MAVSQSAISLREALKMALRQSISGASNQFISVIDIWLLICHVSSAESDILRLVNDHYATRAKREDESAQ